jgi:N-acetylneuraminic acid mutarotase
LALPIGGEEPAAAQTESKEVTSPFADLPELVTSFGGAIADGNLYVYGGHTGGAHSYSLKEQGHQLRRLKLDGKSKWEVVAEGPHTQGLALVAFKDKVYRLGGFTAKNAEGEEHDLWSTSDVAGFDPQSKKWQEMPALPEPRSSFDAAVLNGVIYVIGGWKLQGEGDSQWHKTAWKLDLNQDQAEWQPLPNPPFERRALSVAAHNNKIYAIGGMQEEGGPTPRVDVFDPKTQKWSEAGELQGEPITGFGSSAFATGGQLYVSTIKGNLQKLTEAGDEWEIIQETPTARFFHRMLPLDKNSLIMVGGANMQTGKFEKLEVLKVR